MSLWGEIFEVFWSVIFTKTGKFPKICERFDKKQTATIDKNL